MVRIFTRETNKELKAKVQLSANQFYDLKNGKKLVQERFIFHHQHQHPPPHHHLLI